MILSGKYKILRLTEISSTNLHASALLSGGLIKTPTVILSEFQHHGKGQGGNVWESEAGENVILSLIQFPKHIKASEQFYLSKITALAVNDTIREYVMQTVIKWPNDILVGKKKIAGILIENTIEGDQIRNCIIGAGININQLKFQPYPMKAVSIKMITGREVSLNLVIEKFIQRFDYWYDVMESGDFEQIDKEYLKHLYGFQKILPFRKEGKIFKARIMDVEKDGQIVLQTDKTKLKFGYKELEFVMSGID